MRKIGELNKRAKKGNGAGQKGQEGGIPRGRPVGKRVAFPKARPGPAPAAERGELSPPSPLLPPHTCPWPRPDPPKQALHWQLRMAGSTTGSVRPPGQRRVRIRTGLSGSRL